MVPRCFSGQFACWNVILVKRLVIYQKEQQLQTNQKFNLLKHLENKPHLSPKCSVNCFKLLTQIESLK